MLTVEFVMDKIPIYFLDYGDNQKARNVVFVEYIPYFHSVVPSSSSFTTLKQAILNDCWKQALEEVLKALVENHT